MGNYNRNQIVLSIVIGSSILLSARVAWLQLFDQSSKIRAEATTIDRQILDPSRGLIYDRNDKLLVYNYPVYNLFATYNNLDPEMDVSRFCSLLGITETEFEKNIQKDWSDIRYSKSVPFLFLQKIPADQFLPFLEFLHEFPGFTFDIQNIRGYNHHGASHALGYLSEVDQQTLASSSYAYEKGDFTGVSGIEASYEEDLRGKKGIEYQLRDKFGRRVGAYESGYINQEAVSGHCLQIGIDVDLQSYAESFLKNKIGSVVAVEPSSGEILAIVSSPFYDPEILSTTRNRAEAFRKLQADSLQPFFNRAIMAKYPPGSTFKPVMALIGLQENIISPDRYITCRGAYYYKIFRWGCHAHSPSHPATRNVVGAIQESCNTFFYTIYKDYVDKYGFNNPAQGLDELGQHLNEFGLGRPLGIDLPQESAGLIPTSTFYDNLYKDEGSWRSTYIISNGIGQGEIQLTTIQMANLAAIIANRGFYFTPHLIKSYTDTEKSIPNKYLEKHLTSVVPDHFEPVIRGMELAISNGTAGAAGIPGIAVCGKTGTSENPHGPDHSVFYAFAPKEDPKIAIAVYLENAGWGGTYAAPIGGLIIEKYLNKEIHPSKIWLEEYMLKADLIANL